MINKIEFEFGSCEFTISVGGNSDDNDTLVRQSDPEDYWVHISDFP